MAKKTVVAEGGILRLRSPYDQTYTVLVDATGPVTVTLPSAGTYDSAELQVDLNGQALKLTTDYTYLGVVPRTQVSILQDLKATDEIRFRIVHNP